MIMETAKQFGAFILYLLGCRKKADEIMQRSIKRELESYGWRV